MSKVIVGLILIVALFAASDVRSQQVVDTTTTVDTAYVLPADSARMLDSAYRARKAELDTWVKAQRSAAHPQEDFLSVYLGYGGYLQILPRDLNQLFSERTKRSDPQSDRDEYATVDRSIFLVGEAQLAKTWGIYFEYDLFALWFNTQVSGTNTGLDNAIEELDLTEHSFTVGGMFVIYSGSFYRLRVNGGFGAVIALTSETESPGGYARLASVVGSQISFDILNDFRVSQGISFTLDLLTRSVATGALKTSGGQTLDTPFGVSKTPPSLTPTATNMIYGIAAGIAYYF
jgi:hypothetical protein